MNPRQLAAFRRLRQLFPAARASLANSGGCFLGRRYAFEQVRPGVSLYGGGPFERPDARLRAVATLEAPILQVREAAAGETVGYGATFTAKAPTRLAVVAAGYADGMLRAFSPEGFCWFRGARRRIAGRLSMDLTAFDISGVEDARPGEMVELLGPNAPLNEVAAASGTAAYECLVRLGARGRRTFREAEAGDATRRAAG
jgi:alanine racemase